MAYFIFSNDVAYQSHDVREEQNEHKNALRWNVESLMHCEEGARHQQERDHDLKATYQRGE